MCLACLKTLLSLALLAVASCTHPSVDSSSVKSNTPHGATTFVPANAMAKLPPDATRLCEGHVSGAPRDDGAKGIHVTWEAYATPSDPALLIAHYRRQFGRAPGPDDGDCSSWRQPPADPDHVLKICSLSATGPWSSCGPVPGNTSSIIMISTTSRPD